MGYIEQKENCFFLNTENTTYALRLNKECGYLEHLYYGRRIHAVNEDGLKMQRAFPPGNTICYEKGHETFSLEDECLEVGTLGKGDIREPFAEVYKANGSTTLDLKYSGCELFQGKRMLETLPSAYDDSDQAEGLAIELEEKSSGIVLELIYHVFPKRDVITRSARLKNNGKESIRLKRLLSNQIDFERVGFIFTSFRGSWAREMKKCDTCVISGKVVNASFTGTSSNRCNPFVMLSNPGTGEMQGECYGFNLIYSGNHMEAAEVNGYGKTRFVQGINPQNFEFLLQPDDIFEAPEAVMTYSKDGYTRLSHNMHDFVNNHIVRGTYKNKVRPVLLNSWEAAYFDIDEAKLLKLAKAGKDVGIELFVMDDGWFAQRNDDHHSLGDWYVNQKKLPGGLKRLGEKIKALGMEFGIWVEPEMVNVESELYRKHPDWTLEVPGEDHSEGRNQRLLDLTRNEVQQYIIESMSEVFGQADISYVKWDMNRIFSDYYSGALSADRQGEVAHRYVMGLYHCMEELTGRFPDILFEGCAAGGNRFDLGILCYFPQIWASDNTDAICRGEIQNNYSYGYPQSVYTAHVSSAPNHQTLRRTPLETRFNVASFGILGYECNLADMKAEDLEEVKAQIALYKRWREILQYGYFYRGRSYGGGAEDGSVLANEHNYMEWTTVSKDRSAAVGMLLQKFVRPNTQYQHYQAKGLTEDAVYHLQSRPRKHNIKEFGDLVNAVSPIHIKQDSLVHNVAAHFVKMDSAGEDCKMYGDELMYAGVKLKPGYAGTGYDGNVKYFQDFSSELFLMKKIRTEKVDIEKQI